eukprot:8470777-Prorocentrum_lima.AAC.1
MKRSTASVYRSAVRGATMRARRLPHSARSAALSTRAGRASVARRRINGGIRPNGKGRQLGCWHWAH